jgi:uncharacterized repeat protein (TIGR01451 family)
MVRSKRVTQLLIVVCALGLFAGQLFLLTKTAAAAEVSTERVATDVNALSSERATSSITDTLTPDFTFFGEECPLCLGANLVVDKSDGTTLSPKGSVLAYEITYANAGADVATGVAITETVPENTTFAPTLSSNGWQQIGVSNIYVYDVGTLAKGEGGSVVFAVNMNDTLPPDVETITNTVAIGDDGQHGPDKVPADNASTDVNFIVDEPTDECEGAGSITIGEDTAWTPFNSPHVVDCDVTIPAGVA